MTPPRSVALRGVSARPTALCALALAGLGFSQTGAAQSGLITPTLTTSTTYSSSTRSPDGLGGGEFVARVSPGLNWFSRSGRIQGSVSYALNLNYYGQGITPNSGRRNVDQSLAASVRAVAVENFAFVDAQASISRQAVSAYGLQQVPDSQRANANRSQVASASISPSIRGSLAGLAQYEVRVTASGTSVSDRDGFNSSSSGASATLSSSGGGLIGWGLSAQQQRSRFDQSASTSTERVNAQLSFRPDPELSFSVNGGRESTDVGSFKGRTYPNYGYGVTWLPGPRTSASFQTNHRYFGEGHSLSVSHRMQRTVFSYSDTRDTNGGADNNFGARPPTLYELFFAQFASAQPDPVLRDQLVRDFLRLLGRDPNEVVSGGFLNGGVSLTRQRTLSAAWTGQRLTANLQAFATDSRLLATTSGTLLPGRTRQLGYSASASYRLAPETSATVNASLLRALDVDAQPGNELKSISFSVSHQVGRHTSVSGTVRYSIFDAQVGSYRELAPNVSIVVTF